MREGDRREPVVRLGAVLRLALLASAVGAVAAWSAFADQETTPDVPGTGLSSELRIPVIGASIDYCATSATSLSKAFRVCGTGQPCGLTCGLAWNSALRDLKRVQGQPCYAIEMMSNEQFGGGRDGVFTEADWKNLQAMCIKSIGCTNAECSPSQSSALAPPIDQCSGFTVTNGSYNFPFLTWKSLHYYERNNLGCSGGLNVHDSGPGFTTWACVWTPQCNRLVPNDLACFRYNHVRGEFIFWDWNSRLRLHPGLYIIDATFCEADPEAGPASPDQKRATILNARLANNRGVDLNSIIYVFNSIDPDTGTLSPYVRGTVAGLGKNGCDPIRLQSQTVYWLELDAGGQYYDLRGYFKTNKDNMELKAAVYPKFKSCDEFGVTVNWCVGEGPDIDTYLFYPGEEGGNYVLDEDHMISWTTLNETVKVGEPLSRTPQASITLEIDDSGGGTQGKPFTVGPESVVLRGRLMPGKYAVRISLSKSSQL